MAVAPDSASRRQRKSSREDRHHAERRFVGGVPLDDIDLRILSILQRDGRITKADLALQVHLSASACLERMRRLEKKKIISSYHAIVDLKRLMPLATFYTEVTLANHRYHDFAVFERHLQGVNEVVECNALGGGIDYILKVVTPGIDEYQLLIEHLLDSKIGIDRYFTYIVMKQVKMLIQLPVLELLRGSKTPPKAVAAPFNRKAAPTL